jgi:uncharacterized membrane protein
MRALIELVKTTLLGGVLVILPLWLTVLLLAKAMAGIFALLSPITAHLPATMYLRHVAALLIVAAVCFVAGLIVRQDRARRPRTPSTTIS